MGKTEKIIRMILRMAVAPCALIAPFLIMLGVWSMNIHNGESAVLAIGGGVGSSLVAWICWLLEEPA